jgi:hypothetical protein
MTAQGDGREGGDQMARPARRLAETTLAPLLPGMPPQEREAAC